MKKYNIWSIFIALIFIAMTNILQAGADNTTRPYPDGYNPHLIPAANIEITKNNTKISNQKPIMAVFLEETSSVSIFDDDMESGLNGWSSTGFWHQVINPQTIQVADEIRNNFVQLPDNGYLPSCTSGTTCWWYGEDVTGTFIGADYPVQEALSGGTSLSANTGDLISPMIDLSNVNTAILSFNTWWEIEGVDTPNYDLMHVEISTDGGSTFQTLGNLNPLDDANTDSFIPYSTSGVNQPGVWGRFYFDLSQFAGSTVNIRFRFDTVDSLYNGFRGWFIDDVQVNTEGLPLLNVDSVSPSVAHAGDLVNIFGSGFLQNAVVTIGGTSATISVIFHDKILAYVPALGNGTYDVNVTNLDGTSDTLINGLTVSSETPPDIMSIAPAEGGNDQDTAITISGSNFAAGAVVKLGNITLSNVLFVDESNITAVIPAGLTGGYYNVEVTNPDGLVDTLFAAFKVNEVVINGSISGTIVDATNGQPIVGATVSLSGLLSLQTTTDENGQYFFTDLTPGTYMIEATKTGFTSDSANNELNSGEIDTVNLTLLPNTIDDDLRVVLTWGEVPYDLDSHMWVPMGGSSCYHVYYSNRGSITESPYTSLDIDDTSSYGPETITVYQAMPGVYQYWVYNFSGDPDITTSEANVKIYNGTQLLNNYDIPTAPEGWRAWHVFDINVLTNTIQTINEFDNIENGSCSNSNFTITPVINYLLM